MIVIPNYDVSQKKKKKNKKKKKKKLSTKVKR